ncbi:hypothetical protein GALL_373050 [mine drainage metagenome]|uniref:Porin n=1 Tax=mine drainage metagenome TaxID=410659 RepID=A0A1J5QLV0_9ZZZZ
MNRFKPRLLGVVMSGVFLTMGAQAAHADDSQAVLLKALLNKGILTEEEYSQITHDQGAEKQQAAVTSKIHLGDWIDGVTPEGDIRVRYEYRKAQGNIAGSGNPGSQQLDRARYAWHLGLKTSSDNDFFTEIRFASSTNARSPNVDFSTPIGGTNGSNGPMYKEGAAQVDRLSIGWNVADWLTLLAGRMQNPLYTTTLVWDPDLTPEGLAEQFKTKFGNVDVFATLGQYYVQSKWVQNINNGVDTTTSTIKVFPVQVGARYQFSEDSSIKAAPVLYSYAGTNGLGKFTPGSGTGVGNTAAPYNSGTNSNMGVNNLQVLDIPAEYNWAMGGLSWKIFGDYAYNLQANARAASAGYASEGGQDTALMAGLQFGSKLPLNKWESVGTYLTSAAGLKKHDWVGRVWYQRIDAFALDPNLIDSDVMNAQVNLQGIAASASYMLSDNAFITLSGAHATRIDSKLGTGASVDTSSINPTQKYDLIQMDATWRF